MKRGPYKKAPVNLDDVYIDPEQTKNARIRSYLKQVKDPYHVMIDDVLVEMVYAEQGCTMQEAVETLTSIDRPIDAFIR